MCIRDRLKDTQDKDYTKRTNEFAAKNNNQLTFDQAYSLLKSTPIKNYAFSQSEDLKFDKVSEAWGFDMEGFSNGMATGDLDGDGDLDVVINNINSKASLLRNNANNDNYLKINLKGPPGNNRGYNAKIEIDGTNGKKYKEFQVTRGFQSSCEPIVHFGLMSGEKIKSIKVIWPDQKTEVLTNIQARKIEVDYKNARILRSDKSINNFLEETEALSFDHKEAFFDDYDVQVLLPHLLSQLGPALAKGDVNGDGLEDLYLGGASGQAGSIYVQTKSGAFSRGQSFSKYQATEESEALFFDADGDQDLDLYVGTASNQESDSSDKLKDRLYLNNGQGQFSLSDRLPNLIKQTGTVVAGDYDGDGDLDLFVGGRLVHGKYPNPANSTLLENTAAGFVDVTTKVASDLQSPGMITDGAWTDYDGDGDLDLMLVGEWTDVLLFENNEGQFSRNKRNLSKSIVGWWNSIEPADLDKDGDMDYVLGNLGENYKYQASDDEPFEVFAGDFDNSGVQDIVVSYYSEDKLYPVRGFQCSSEQIPDLKKKIATYEDFGQSDVFKVYGAALDDALHYQANCFSSMILWNEGGQLTPTRLPYQAQLSPVQTTVVTDIDADGDQDIITAGNWFVAEIETPRADAGVGTVLLNEGDKKFRALSASESGFFANGDVRNMVGVKGSNGQLQLVIGNNNAEAQVFKLK